MQVGYNVVFTEMNPIPHRPSLPDLASKNIGSSVTFEFQLNNT